VVFAARVRVNVPISAPRPTESSARLPYSRQLALALAVSCCACTAAPTRAALSGDLTALKAAVTSAEQQGQLGRGRVRQLAEAVLTRELVSLAGPELAFPQLGSCAEAVTGVLSDLAEREGELGEAAAIALIDAGVTPPVAASDAHTPALLARQAIGVDAGIRRRAFMLHGDVEVRRAALTAAWHSADPGDVPALLEAARVDPDPEARGSASWALGRVGGAAVVLGLRDLWPRAAPLLRRRIIEAWSMPGSFDAGGERELVAVVETESSLPAVLAALSLHQKNAGPPGLATAALLRALAGVDTERRLFTLLGAPWSDPELRAAIVSLVSSKDAATRVVALLRLSEHAEIDAASLAELRKLSLDPTLPVALVARAVLARAGDASVKPGLLRDLAAPRADHRTLAAVALISLKQWSAAAHALADDSPQVRRAVSCQLLAEPAFALTPEERTSAPERPFGPRSPALLPLLLPARS
jgi:HEAT repeat protein